MPDEKRLRIAPQLAQRAREFRRPLTPMEARLWAYLRGHRCGGFKFRRQVVLGRYIADFCCSEVRLVVEVDGLSHNASVERDAVRDEYLALRGYATLRVANTDVRDNLEGVLIHIARVCAERNASQSDAAIPSQADP